jgi:hypothetical protein
LGDEKVITQTKNPIFERTKIMASLIALFEKMYNKPSTPLFIEGTPGGGKTQLVREFARAMSAKLGKPYPLVTMQLASMEESDLAGMPSLVNNRTIWSQPAWVDSLQGGGILFLDELNCARKSVMDTALSLIQNRMLPNGSTIPETVLIIGAYNPADLCSNEDFNPALLNRGLVVAWNPSIADWAGWFLGTGSVALESVVAGKQTTLVQWEKAWFGDDKSFELDKRILFTEALKEGLVFTDPSSIEINSTFTSGRSLENLFYWCDSVTQIADWAPAFVDAQSADILKRVSAIVLRNVNNAIFNGGNTEDNSEEAQRLRENQDIINRMKKAAE